MVSTVVTKTVLRKELTKAITKAITQSEKRMKDYVDERDKKMMEGMKQFINQSTQEMKLHFDTTYEKLFHDFSGGLGDVHAGVKNHEWRLKRLEIHTRIA